MFDSAFFVFFVLIVIFSFGEFAISSAWAPFFFRFGIPLYRQEFRLMEGIGNLETYIGELEGQLPRKWQQPAIAFRALSHNELAFRQKFGQRNPAHGILVYDMRRQLLSLTGYLPWSVFIFPVFFVIFLFWGAFPFPFLFLLFILLIMGFSFFVQRRNYGRIAAAIQQTFQKEITTDEIVTIPEYQPYDPFSTSATQSQFPVNIILVVLFLGLLALFIFALVFFFLLY